MTPVAVGDSGVDESTSIEFDEQLEALSHRNCATVVDTSFDEAIECLQQRFGEANGDLLRRHGSRLPKRYADWYAERRARRYISRNSRRALSVNDNVKASRAWGPPQSHPPKFVPYTRRSVPTVSTSRSSAG